MKRIKIICGAMLSGVLLFLTGSFPGKLFEAYCSETDSVSFFVAEEPRAIETGEIVLRAKWGKGPDEVAGREQDRTGSLEKGPMTLAVDRKGRLYVLDTGNTRVMQLGPDGKLKKVFDYPNYPAKDLVVIDEDLFAIIDMREEIIRFYDSSGRELSTLEGTHPSSMAVTPEGGLSVYNEDKAVCMKFNRSCELVGAIISPEVRPVPVSSGELFGVTLSPEKAVIYRAGWNGETKEVLIVRPPDREHYVFDARPLGEDKNGMLYIAVWFAKDIDPAREKHQYSANLLKYDMKKNVLAGSIPVRPFNDNLLLAPRQFIMEGPDSILTYFFKPDGYEIVRYRFKP